MTEFPLTLTEFPLVEYRTVWLRLCTNNVMQTKYNIKFK